ncbi:hypothetical protein KNT70_gp129 [Cronobacter phage Pet-CM3-4]|uniref:Uncharacterized protein n=1 Tax=Cronobacter phage Pet-CM3-4 TaxID=1892569 RepID=A0A1D3RKQ1_9CAUD|nr:hypothetical protein KNT70_gp129 [Cronobacter phage Pet-CM3-4]SCN45822.1 hypothetical protein [Cronobacter phage Pet-CM3-4]
MLNFKEFIAESDSDMITEAGERMTKMKWQSAMDLVPPGERNDFMKFAASVQKLYGIGTSNPQDYYKVQNAFKSLRGIKSPAKAPKETKAAPAKAPAPAAAPVVKPVAPIQAPKATPAPKVNPDLYKFDVKGIVNKYEKILALLNEISKDGAVLKTQFAKIRRGRNISNIDTPELMDLYTTVETVAYTTGIAKEVRKYIESAHRVDVRAKALKKVEAK